MNSTEEEIKLLYLLSGSCDLLPSSCVKLRSYLNIHLSNTADRLNLQLLKNFRNRNKTCPYCYSSWSGNTSSFKLLPSKRLKTPRGKSKVTESEESQSCQLNESRNTMVLKCKVCSKKSAFSLIKRKPIKEKREEEEKVITTKKKKKKRDKTCGLAVNLLKPEINLPETLIVKKKKRVEGSEGTAAATSQSDHLGTAKITPISKNIANPVCSRNIQSQKNTLISKRNSNSISANGKSFLPNPFASQIQHNPSKKKSKKLEKLKQAVKGEKSPAKKTLKDFLTLV